MKRKPSDSIRKSKSSTVNAPLSWAFTIALVATSGLIGPVLAADLAVNDTGVQVTQAVSPGLAVSPSAQTGSRQATPPVAGAGGRGVATYTIPPPPSHNPYALADQLKLRGWIVPTPGAADTVDRGLFGVRNALAELGISYLAFESTSFQDNLLRHGLPPGNAFGPHSRDLQLYNGQLPTYSTSIAFFGMYDLRRYGIPDGQITLGGSIVSTNWAPSLPDGIALAVASYYQTLFNKRVEIKLGYLTNSTEFLGSQVGGNLAGGIFGVNALINYENGENLPSAPTPGANVKVNFPKNIYTKLGVQRALSPDEILVERAENPTSLKFTVPNAGVFVIDETGYRVNAAPGRMSTWIRAAASYTSSKFMDFSSLTGGRRSNNYGLYFLTDRQIIQTAPHAGPGSAFRGLYAGFSLMYAPSYFNPFSQYVEGRIYGFGLIPGRPFDQLSLVANRNIFSKEAVRGVRSVGLLAHNGANTYTAAYSAHVLPGVNVNVGVGYTDHPTTISYDRSTGSAFSILTNLFFFL